MKPSADIPPAATPPERSKKMQSILKPEWHEDFDKIFLGTPGSGVTHYPKEIATTKYGTLPIRSAGNYPDESKKNNPQAPSPPTRRVQRSVTQAEARRDTRAIKVQRGQ